MTCTTRLRKTLRAEREKRGKSPESRIRGAVAPTVQDDRDSGAIAESIDNAARNLPQKAADPPMVGKVTEDSPAEEAASGGRP
jgi:hypothetical protein